MHLKTVILLALLLGIGCSAGSAKVSQDSLLWEQARQLHEQAEYDSAFTAYDKLYNYQDSLYRKLYSQKIEALRDTYQLEELELENKRQLNSLYLKATLSLAALILLGILCWVYLKRSSLMLIRSKKEMESAKELAEISKRNKSLFLSNMSHEIRTPLNAVIGFAKLMLTAETEQEKEEYAAIIDINSELLLHLINDILDISKIEAGTLEFEFKPMNLNELCRSEYEVHKTRVKPGVELVFEEKAADNVEIVCDRNRLAQVITNLLNNASKFTERGEIRFGFDVCDGKVEFFVRDTGAGIPEERVKEIFDRFVKLNHAAAGSGLGLSISKMIIERMDGQIEVESAEGRGTCFRFTIPVKHHEKTLPVNPVVEGAGIRTETDCWTLLVAEDSETNFRLIGTVLGKRFKLIRAHTGAEAVEQFERVHPHAVLMDLRMPVMDGFEATRRIRRISRDVPVIAMSAYTYGNEREQAREAGCNEFLSKPLSPTDLHKALNGCLLELDN